MKNKILFLTMIGCHNCEAAKKIFDEIMPEFKDKVEVEEIDIASPRGQELVGKYSVMASPGIVINEELFSTGGVSKNKLVEKLKLLVGENSGENNTDNKNTKEDNTDKKNSCCA